MTEPLLSEQDRQSAAWMKLKAHYEARLAKYRAMNDEQKPETDTARLRGKIAEVKAFLALGEPPKPRPPHDEFKD